ncbi:two-partner secretion domain-containing protein, partial [Variovorax sp. JS1663]|uniref:two-partner secretion domain-containing protein n=1 Tax=Variovorax sp. JS1663 TaxID=1851577 RepID=UPI00117C9DEE
SLNRAYRLVFNQAQGTCVVAPETARSAGGAGAGATSSPAGLLQTRLKRLALAMVLGLDLCAATAWAAEPSPLAANTLPRGGQVAAGSASLSTSGSTMTVGQASQRAIINWSSFDVGAAAAVNFVQPNAAAVTLNRVTGGSASQIFGRVSANGQIYLVNPSGVLFGRGAQVDAGGLVASTLGITDADFLAGRDRFTQGPGEGASVVNQGRISVSPGGRIALLGTRVSNQGQLLAPGGDVALAAGRQVTLVAGADGHLQLGVDASELATLVNNGGLIQADGGSITLNAQGASALASAVVSNTGTLQARTVDSRNGRILLLADQGQGGRVQVDGTLDASAPAGGNGGFIETSARQVQVADGVRVSTQAPQGKTGTWLVDPTDFTIGAGSAAQSASGIGADTLSANLASTSIALQTAAGGTEPGDIHVNAPVSWNANTLTLNAANNININAVMTAGGTAGLALNYGGTNGSAAATPVEGSNVNVALTGSGFTGRVDFTGAGNNLSINGTPYTLIKNVAALQGIDGNRGGHYALANDIDATATASWNAGAGFSPIGAFSGNLDGLGHVVNGLSINRPGQVRVGLFSQTWIGSMVRNLGLAGGSVTGDFMTGSLVGEQFDGSISNAYATDNVSGNRAVGGLVGELLSGSITNAYATGSVSGNRFVGGLVGAHNGGSISNAYATGGVSGGDVLGGLVGTQNNGSISNTYATGNVSGGGMVGGLVGYLGGGSLGNAYATGGVSGSSAVGGLVGRHDGGSISSAYWNIDTTGQSGSASGGSGAGCANYCGLTAAQMMTASSFAGWDLATQGGSTSVWRIYEGSTAPLLRSFLTPLTVTATTGASKVYDGTVNAGSAAYTASGPAAVNPGLILGQGRTASKNVGSYSVDLSGLYSTQQGYDIRVAPTAGSFAITPKALSGSIIAANKVYDKV